GVDHFYLYDNDSMDNQAEVAAPYVKAGLVDYFPYPGKAMQYAAYNDAVKRFKFQTRYMAFIDGDEFIYPKLTGGGGLLMSSTRFYKETKTRRLSELIGNVLARTVRKRRIILAACWRDLRAVLSTIGLSSMQIIFATEIFG
ncbi:MAG: glycosyltransferase family 92 protein, partial [Selenomonadaceae bacterium]|nr:glycosyltransferase family 92 protein [Selenomonadaceae bacterium]